MQKGQFRQRMLRSHKLGTLSSLRRCVLNTSHTDLQIPERHSLELAGIFLNEMQSRPGITHHTQRKTKAERELVVVIFMSRYMSYVPMAAIAHETFTAATVGLGIFGTEKIPLFVHKYSRTLGSEVYNYKPFLKKMTKTKIIDILRKPCKCRTGDLGYDDELEHTCTSDLNFVKNEELRGVMSRGTRYRMPEDFDGGDETGTVSSCLLLMDGLGNW